MENGNRAFLISVLTATAYFGICFFLIFVLTPGSDPLEYVTPALNPENGFQYADRIILWYWLRIFASLPVPNEYISGLSTLTATAVSLFLGAFWMAYKQNYFSSFLYVILFTLNPIIIGNATHTYPMQLMTMVILAVYVVMSLIESEKKKMMFGGFGLIIAVFTKVQAWPFLAYLLFVAIKRNKSNVKMGLSYLIFGMMFGLLAIVMLVVCVDGFDVLIKIYKIYFIDGVAVEQYKGRALGGLPPFERLLLDPSFIVGFLSAVVCLLRINKSRNMSVDLAVISLGQLFGIGIVYMITQRGGVLITNYFFDFSVFSLLCASSILGVADDSGKCQINGETLKMLYGFAGSLIPLAVLFGVIEHTSSPILYKFPMPNTENIVISALTALSMLALIWSTDYRRRTVFGLIGMLVILILSVNAKNGVKDAMHRKEFWYPMHQASRYLKGNKEEETWVNVKLTRSTTEIGSESVRKIFTTLYSSDSEANSNIYFGEEPAVFERVITDDKETVRRLESSYKTQKSIAFEYSYGKVVNGVVWTIKVSNGKDLVDG